MSIEINESSLRLDDGQVINLSSIKEVKPADNIIGNPSHPLMISITNELGKGNGVVYLLYITPHGPETMLITTSDPSSAVVLAMQIKEAIEIAKKAGASIDRVTVGECTNCHRPLRVKANAVRSQMVLTCKCGYKNQIHTN
jgi:hypothetical protein